MRSTHPRTRRQGNASEGTLARARNHRGCNSTRHLYLRLTQGCWQWAATFVDTILLRLRFLRVLLLLLLLLLFLLLGWSSSSIFPDMASGCSRNPPTPWPLSAPGQVLLGNPWRVDSGQA